MTITLHGSYFPAYKRGYDVKKWFKTTVEGLRYELYQDIEEPYTDAKVRIYGTPIYENQTDTIELALKSSFFYFGHGENRYEC